MPFKINVAVITPLEKSLLFIMASVQSVKYCAVKGEHGIAWSDLTRFFVFVSKRVGKLWKKVNESVETKITL